MLPSLLPSESDPTALVLFDVLHLDGRAGEPAGRIDAARVGHDELVAHQKVEALVLHRRQHVPRAELTPSVERLRALGP